MSHEHYVESLLQDPQDENFYHHHHHSQPQSDHFQTSTSTSTAIPESPMQKFRIEISKFRSSSAPPSVEELVSQTVAFSIFFIFHFFHLQRYQRCELTSYHWTVINIIIHFTFAEYSLSSINDLMCCDAMFCHQPTNFDHHTYTL